MATQDQFPLSKQVSFEVYPSLILGNNFKNVKVMGIVDADTARMLGLDAPAMHANVYPTLPQGSVDAYDEYLYVRVKHSNGQQSILGLPWIKTSSVQVLDYTNVMVRVGNVNPGEAEKILEALAANGFHQVEIVKQSSAI
jgi:hypothetical protein